MPQVKACNQRNAGPLCRCSQVRRLILNREWHCVVCVCVVVRRRTHKHWLRQCSCVSCAVLAVNVSCKASYSGGKAAKIGVARCAVMQHLLDHLI